MKLEFENVYFDIRDVIERYSDNISAEYDLISVLEEYADLVNFDNDELMTVIKDDKDFYNKIVELYKIKNGL